MSNIPWPVIHEITFPYDHPELISITNSRGKKITIPVSLQFKGATVLKAEVSMLPTPMRANAAAVFILEHKLRENHLYLQWDKAVSGVGEIEHEAGNYMRGDTFCHDVMGFVGGSLRDRLNTFRTTLKMRLENGGAPPSPDEMQSVLARAIVANTATVKSGDMEKMLHERQPKPWYRFRKTSFEPQGLEF